MPYHQDYVKQEKLAEGLVLFLIPGVRLKYTYPVRQKICRSQIVDTVKLLRMQFLRKL